MFSYTLPAFLALVLIATAAGQYWSPPAFHAELNTLLKNVKPRTIVKFDKPILNKGNAFNPKNGIFTAPETGYYYFAVTLMALGGKPFNLQAQIVAGNKSVSRVYLAHTGKPSTSTVSTQGMAFMKRGQTAFVRTIHPAIYIHRVFSSFTGFAVA